MHKNVMQFTHYTIMQAKAINRASFFITKTSNLPVDKHEKRAFEKNTMLGG